MRNRIERLSTLIVGAIALISASGTPCLSQGLPQRLYDVVYHHAPFIIAETRNAEGLPESVDHLLPIDFDGDVDGTNNAAHASSQYVIDGRPTVYFSIIETGTTTDQGYFFIGYYFYHPRDGGQTFAPVGGGPVMNFAGHEHDLEGAYLVVKKNAYTPYGNIVGALTQAHGALIPYPNMSGPDFPAITPTENSWGSVYFWHEPETGMLRSVVAVRAQTHGTYMAQNCNPAFWEPDWGWGMYAEAESQFGTPFVSCRHANTQVIVYRPSYDGTGVGRLGPYVRSALAPYRLVDLHESPIWQQREQTTLFSGPYVRISDAGDDAFSFFRSSTGSHDANAPWVWRGGAGECFDIQIIVGCWYSFGVDNTGTTNSRIFWYEAWRDGNLLTRASLEMSYRFNGLNSLAFPDVFSQYWTPVPPPPPPPFTVYVEGDAQVSSGMTGMWTAFPEGGASPYAYSWAADYPLDQTGTSQTFMVAFPYLGYEYNSALYVTVQDATGASVSVIKYVTVD